VSSTHRHRAHTKEEGKTGGNREIYLVTTGGGGGQGGGTDDQSGKLLILIGMSKGSSAKGRKPVSV